MSEKKTKTNSKPKRKLSKPALLLIIGLLIIFIPLTVFGIIILHSAVTNNKPVLGDRFKNDLQPAITTGNINDLKDKINSISGVESCDIVLTTAQLRINIDALDSYDEDALNNIANQAYEDVDELLPIQTYFTATADKKMYDLAINAFNFIEADNDAMVYVLLTKNSKMNSSSIQTVSKPVNTELAAELRGDLPLETVTPTVEPEQ